VLSHEKSIFLRENAVSTGLDFLDLTDSQFVAAAKELCASGLLTCTQGKPGAAGSTYALAWMPLNNPDRFSTEVRARHNVNMLRIQRPRGSA
jgi:hypothetical protein